MVAVLRLRDLAASRARAAQLVLSLGVPVVTPTGLRLDPADRVVRWLARERTEHRASSRAALDAKRSRGERIGGIPSGYRLAEDGVHLVPAPAEQQTISRAVGLRSLGTSYRQVAKTLNEEGHRSRGGGRITHGQVSRWIRAREKTGNGIAPQGVFRSVNEQIDR